MIRPSLQLSKPTILLYVLLFGFAGTLIVFVSQASGSSTITGTVFQDINKNGLQDPGEAPLANKSVYLIDEAGVTRLGFGVSDGAGKFAFTGLNDGKYQVVYGSNDWWEIRADWVPTTTGSVAPKRVVNLTGQATVNFGWRQIVRSFDLNNPITSLTAPNGIKINSYDDVVSATELYAELAKGSLSGVEASVTRIDFDYPVAPDPVTGVRNYNNNQPNITFSGVNGSPGYFSGYTATIKLGYISWLDSGDSLMFHEYGHAWSLRYAYIEAQNTDFIEYLKVRGIENDSRLDSTHGWSRREMIAEDYRQLFGSPNAQAHPQENRAVPLAKDVPGLKEYLAGAFMQSAAPLPPPPPSADISAPSAPIGLVGRTVSGSEGIEIDLSWTASVDNVGVADYLVFRDGLQIGSVNSPSTSFIDTTNIAPGASYRYYVRAVDVANNISTASQTITVTVPAPDTLSPSTPSGLISPSQTNNSIALKWNASTDNVGVSAYRIYRIGGSRKLALNTLVGTITGSTFTATGLSRGTSYSFFVVAVDAAGNVSSPSSTLVVKTKR
ncbi:MAG TPA: SdrD B-like domain-containing protein [Candidatus Saccharimonadia bacterium]